MEFSRWNNSKFAFAFMSGRVSLSACIYALNLQPGDEVILPAYTCVVVPNAFTLLELNQFIAILNLKLMDLM